MAKPNMERAGLYTVTAAIVNCGQQKAKPKCELDYVSAKPKCELDYVSEKTIKSQKINSVAELVGPRP